MSGDRIDVGSAPRRLQYLFYPVLWATRFRRVRFDLPGSNGVLESLYEPFFRSSSRLLFLVALFVLASLASCDLATVETWNRDLDTLDGTARVQ